MEQTHYLIVKKNLTFCDLYVTFKLLMCLFDHMCDNGMTFITKPKQTGSISKQLILNSV